MVKPPRDPHAHRSPTEPEAPEADEANPLARWSRRKRLARAGRDPDARDDAAAAPGDAGRNGAAAAETPEPEREPTDEDMPPLESIDAETDMSGFFSSKVSAAVRHAALRKFFHSSAFNVLDGLDDYNEDYTTFEALGEIVTADMRLQAERRAEKAKQALLEDEEAAEGDVAERGDAEPAGGETAGAGEAPQRVAEEKGREEETSSRRADAPSTPEDRT